MRAYLVVVPFGLIIACSGAGVTVPPGNGDDGGTDGKQTLGDAAASSDSPTNRDANTADVGPTIDGSGSPDVSVDSPEPVDATADGPDCPIVEGKYGSIMESGTGCGDLNPLASECIRQNTCHITFMSGAGNAGGAISGEAQLASSGMFSGANLTLGTLARSGCTGSWNASSQTMTVDCGGSSSTQSCIVTMTRTNASCQ